MELSPEDRRRWAKLLEWLKEEKRLNNSQIGKILSCVNSSVSEWINKKRTRLHIHTVERMSNYLAITEDDLLKIITEDANMTISQRIELMRSSRSQSSPVTTSVEEILEKLNCVPVWELHRIIYAAVEKLNNTLELGMLSEAERIQISKLTLASAERRKLLGGSHKEKLESLLQETSFLRQILLARGGDFLLLENGGYCCVEEHVQRSLVAFCYQATWIDGHPNLEDPLCGYTDFNELVRNLTPNGTREHCRPR